MSREEVAVKLKLKTRFDTERAKGTSKSGFQSVPPVCKWMGGPALSISKGPFRVDLMEDS